MKLLCDQMSEAISECLHHSQHGFKVGKSILTNLAQFTPFILCKVEGKIASGASQIDAVYTDFSKAFDRVDHGLLLLKLKKLGMPSEVVNWSASYLNGRTQKVRIGGTLSEVLLVRSGVPQGSHLGPLLFLLFINDITYFLKDVEFLLYADDLKLYKTISNDSDALVLQLML